jgi:hypothetical protein
MKTFIVSPLLKKSGRNSKTDGDEWTVSDSKCWIPDSRKQSLVLERQARDRAQFLQDELGISSRPDNKMDSQLDKPAGKSGMAFGKALMKMALPTLRRKKSVSRVSSSESAGRDSTNGAREVGWLGVHPALKSNNPDKQVAHYQNAASKVLSWSEAPSVHDFMVESPYPSEAPPFPM